ncbi:YciI family protein [Mangrovibacterium diazotrophicum]|uniref:YCII-related domain-containing protein n=1 Tax=Mangrovibacterium diazotrophicum TaxID=1261403 RepID=A0A419W2M5_9BACT|nr:YciI family protein [Mangrovibacterium diazotrophicum]RKD89732.1 YCII-related domain-containing protein [Mangrovibacterium diazotrophicum]
MKKLLFVISAFLISVSAFAQREFSMTEGDTTYVMKRYVFMHLLSGTERSQDSLEAAKIQEQHLAHLNKMADSGKLVVAGPFENGGEYRGLLIFDVETIEEALALEGEDPAVKAKRLKMQAFYWWGAKGTKLP